MKAHRIVLTIVAALAALAVVACATTDDKKKDEPALQPVKAKVQGVTQTGVDSGKPILEITGTMPGTGWTPQVEVKETDNGVEVYVMAVPGPGAKKGADTPFTQKVVVEQAKPGKPVKVFDHRGVEIKRIEVK